MSQFGETASGLPRSQMWQPAAGCKSQTNRTFYFSWRKCLHRESRSLTCCFLFRTCPTPNLEHHLPLLLSTPIRARLPVWHSTSPAAWQLQPLVKEPSSACSTQRPGTNWWSCAEEQTLPLFTGKHSSSKWVVHRCSCVFKTSQNQTVRPQCMQQGAHLALQRSFTQ